jgi:hypothetical protein
VHDLPRQGCLRGGLRQVRCLIQKLLHSSVEGLVGLRKELFVLICLMVCCYPEVKAQEGMRKLEFR